VGLDPGDRCVGWFQCRWER